MSFYYMFLNGKIVLKEDGKLPHAHDAQKFESYFINKGYVDKQHRDGDQWAELSTETPLSSEFSLCERRTSWTLAGEEQFFRIGKAFHYMDWQRLHKYCGKCGAKNTFDPGEGAMKCTKCGEFFYPVIAPAIIVCVEKGGKILLGHSARFPSGRYSVLAGFVEPGEDLEECVSREVFEESGISLKNIKYFASQPWAFPRSLMIGFTAEWASGDVHPDMSEIVDVRWFAPDEIPDYYRGVSISAKLIEDFVRRHTEKQL